jgi:hypothetical protein
MAEASSRDEAVEALAIRLHWKLGHLDPPIEDWKTLSQDEKDLYRIAIEHVLSAPAPLIDAARLPPFAGDYPIGRHSKVGEKLNFNDDGFAEEIVNADIVEIIALRVRPERTPN